MRREALLAALLAVSPALGHGAAAGLHLHLAPEEAAPGDEVEITADAALPLVELRIGIAGRKETTSVIPKAPSSHLVTRVKVPAEASGTVSLHAEGRTAGGKTVRASALVKVVSAARSGKRSRESRSRYRSGPGTSIPRTPSAGTRRR